MARRFIVRSGSALIAATLLLTIAPSAREVDPSSAAGDGTGQLAAGGDHTCANYRERVWCWGRNDYGQLGNGAVSNAPRYRPSAVVGLTGSAIEITTGDAHTCAIVGGALKCWGWNASGQLGDASTANRTAPVQVVDLTSGVTHADAGRAHTCAIVDGAVRCWGANANGQLGDGTTTNRPQPVTVSGLTAGATHVSTGWFHSCAVVNGGVRCWGANGFGQLGDGTTTARTTPVTVAGLSNVAAVATGAYHSCALYNTDAEHGLVKCWGANWRGQLGDGSTWDRHTPIFVSGESAPYTTALTAGAFHTCVVRVGFALCWGANDYGQLGHCTFNDRNYPLYVNSDSSCSSRDVLRTNGTLIAGNGHTCAITPTGDIVCWGANWFEQIGRPGSDRTYPVKTWDMTRGFVLGLTPFTGDGGRIASRLGLAENGIPSADDLAADTWLQSPWPRHNMAGGGIRPAFGDVDGDGLDELVLGFTGTTFANGWIVVLDDAAHDYAVLQWLQVQWPAYNESNGETFPAVGDVDNDGRAEVVVGLGQGSGGWYEIFDDASAGFAHVAWRRVNWWAYQRDGADGRTHPAVADLDGNGESEIVLGLGPGSNGWIEVVNGASSSFAHRAWIQVQWLAYTQANGITYPAAGDWDNDGRSEIVVGLGNGGGCWYEIFDDASAGFAHVTFRLARGWPEYCSAVGELHPAAGQLDNDTPVEVVFGLAPYPGNGGWFAAIDDSSRGSWDGFIGWRNVDWHEFRQAGGGTFPAIGRRAAGVQ